MAKVNFRDYSLSFGEDVVASELSTILNGINKKQYSIYAPLSRQEKGIDLLIRNNNNGKTASIQVKESRIFKNKTRYRIWFKYFEIDEKQRADFYALMTMYPYYNGNGLMKMSAVQYEPLILIFTYEEMKEELDNLTRTKNGNKDKYFYHEFSDENDIKLTRGYQKGTNTLNNGNAERGIYLLKNKFQEIIDSMK